MFTSCAHLRINGSTKIDENRILVLIWHIKGPVKEMAFYRCKQCSDTFALKRLNISKETLNLSFRTQNNDRIKIKYKPSKGPPYVVHPQGIYLKCNTVRNYIMLRVIHSTFSVELNIFIIIIPLVQKDLKKVS